jgi:hypothetical protein
MSPEMMPRRYPPPWSVEETPACFIVRDHGGQALGQYRGMGCPPDLA